MPIYTIFSAIFLHCGHFLIYFNPTNSTTLIPTSGVRLPKRKTSTSNSVTTKKQFLNFMTELHSLNKATLTLKFSVWKFKPAIAGALCISSKFDSITTMRLSYRVPNTSRFITTPLSFKK